MSAALKSYVPRPVPSRRRPTITPATLRSSAATLPAASQTQVSQPLVLPTATRREAASPVLRLLSQLQLVSSALAVSLVTLTLLSYGTSVYVSRQLSQTSQQLNRLQRSEQQLTTANEVLKNHLAQQVQGSAVGFQPPQPGSVIFLKPSPQTAAVALPNQVSNGVMGRLALPQVNVPLGY